MDPIWQNITTALEVPSEVADKWLAKLKQQYSQPSRHYHNEEQMLRRKAVHLSGSSVCLQLALLFQYYNFDAGKDCVQENCDALKEFLAEAKVDNVSADWILRGETIDNLVFTVAESSGEQYPETAGRRFGGKFRFAG